MESFAQQQLDEIVSRVVISVPTRAIYLFGSYDGCFCIITSELDYDAQKIRAFTTLSLFFVLLETM